MSLSDSISTGRGSELMHIFTLQVNRLWNLNFIWRGTRTIKVETTVKENKDEGVFFITFRNASTLIIWILSYAAVALLTGDFLSMGLMMNFLSLKEMFLISLQGKPIFGVSLKKWPHEHWHYKPVPNYNNLSSNRKKMTYLLFNNTCYKPNFICNGNTISQMM